MYVCQVVECSYLLLKSNTSACVRARVRACVYEAQTKAASLNAVESDLLIEMTMDDPLFAEFCLVAKQVTRCIKRQVSFKLSFNIRLTLLFCAGGDFGNKAKRTG